MNIDIITKQDIISLEEKINDLVVSAQANEVKGLGIVYNTRDLSERLKVSTKTINNWRDDRLIEFSKVHNTILYTEQAVIDFLAAHTIKRKNNIVNRLNAIQDGNGKK